MTVNNHILPTESVEEVIAFVRKLEDDVVVKGRLGEGEAYFGMRLSTLMNLTAEANGRLRELIATAENGPSLSLADHEQYDSLRRRLNEAEQKIHTLHTRSLTLAHRDEQPASDPVAGSPEPSPQLTTGADIAAASDSLRQTGALLWRLAELADSTYDDRQYEAFADNLRKDYTLPGTPCHTKALRIYNEWDARCLDADTRPRECHALLSAQLSELLRSPFVVVDERHVPISYRQNQRTLTVYVDTADIDDDLRKRSYVFGMLVDHPDWRFLFNKSASLAKYIFNNRHRLTTADVEVYFVFEVICTLVYQNHGEQLLAAWTAEHKSRAAERKEQRRQAPAAKAPGAKPTGRPGAKLFRDERVAQAEAKRLKGYVSAHGMGRQKLDTRTDNPLNRVVVCFLMVWRKRGLLADAPSGPSVLRFLCQHCGLEAVVTERTYGNWVLGVWNRPSAADDDTLRSVAGWG